MFCYQRNGFCCCIKRSVLHLGLWVHKRFLSITYRRCMTASATPYAKDFLSPNFGYRDRCFVIPFMMIFLMECSTTPILVKGLVGFLKIIRTTNFEQLFFKLLRNERISRCAIYFERLSAKDYSNCITPLRGKRRSVVRAKAI